MVTVLISGTSFVVWLVMVTSFLAGAEPQWMNLENSDARNFSTRGTVPGQSGRANKVLPMRNSEQH
jgi:hypothetical protein